MSFVFVENLKISWPLLTEYESMYMCTVISVLKCTFTCIIVNGDCVRKTDGCGSIVVYLTAKETHIFQTCWILSKCLNIVHLFEWKYLTIIRLIIFFRHNKENSIFFGKNAITNKNSVPNHCGFHDSNQIYCVLLQHDVRKWKTV